MLPVPTTVTGPGITAVPLKWVSQPRERSGSSWSRTVGNVDSPSVLMSINRMRGVWGLVSKTPFGLAVVVLGDVRFVVSVWLGLFWIERRDTIGSM